MCPFFSYFISPPCQDIFKRVANMPSYISSNLSANLIKKAFLELNYSKMFFCSSPLSVHTTHTMSPASQISEDLSWLWRLWLTFTHNTKEKQLIEIRKHPVWFGMQTDRYAAFGGRFMVIWFFFKQKKMLHRKISTNTFQSSPSFLLSCWHLKNLFIYLTP